MRINFGRITLYLLYATLLLPLAYTPFIFFPWHFGKTVLFQMVIEIVLVALVISRIWRNRPPSRGLWQTLTALNWLDRAILVFFAVSVITALTGVNASNSFWGNEARANGIFTWLNFGIWYFLIRTVAPDENGRQNLLWLTTGVAVLASLTVIFPQLLPSGWQSEAGGGIIGNRDFAANYLLASFGLSFLLWQSKKYYFALAASAIIGYALLGAGSRGAFLGLVAGFGAGLLFAILALSKRKPKIAVGYTLVGLVFLIIGIFWLSSIPSFQRAFPAVAYYANLKQFATGTGETRLMAWDIAWQGIKARPLQGWGWGNFDVVFNKFYNPRFLKFNFSETVWDKPHNWPLEIFVTTGVFGALAYLGIYAAALAYLWRDKQSGAWQRIVLAGTLAGYFVQSLFLFETSNSLLLFFLMLAIIPPPPPVAAAAISSSTTAANPQPIYSPRLRLWLSRVFAFVAVAALAILLVANGYFPLRASYFLNLAHSAPDPVTWSINADKALAVPSFSRGETAIFLAERFTQFDKAGIPLTNSSAVASALAVAGELERQSNRYPNDPLFPGWAGQVYLVLGQQVQSKYYADAERLFKRALALSPERQEWHFFLGQLYILEKLFPEAIEIQKSAVAAAPGLNIGHWFFGLTYVAAGNLSAGLAEMEKAIAFGYPLSRDQRLYMIDLYIRAKEYDKVVAGYQDLIGEEPDNVNWHVKLAMAYAFAGDKAAALREVHTAVGMNPSLKSSADQFIKQYKL